MQRFKLTISYDGTNYAGWQQQPVLRTVEGTIQKAFAAVFSKDMRFLGASRTDAGVHAFGQVAMLDTDLDVTSEKLAWALNNALPNDIMITDIKKVDDTFHTHHNVVAKTYHYHFFTDRPSPFIHRYGWYFYKKVNFDKLQRALDCFVGTHDFRSFATDEHERETIRTIDAISIDYCEQFGAHRIVVTGEKFLRHMIRRMVGTALEVSSRDSLSTDTIIEKLNNKNPANALINAPAQGLFLYDVRYRED